MKIIKTFSDYKRLSPLTVILDFTIFISQLQSLFYIQIENDSVLADLVIQAAGCGIKVTLEQTLIVMVYS